MGQACGYVGNIAGLQLLPGATLYRVAVRLAGIYWAGRIRVPPVTRVAVPASTQNRWA